MAAVKLCAVAFALALAASVLGDNSACTETTCSRNETCCVTPQGGPGCCPYQDAVCCLDGIHCCPSGTVCDQEHRRCVNVDEQILGQFTFVKMTAPNDASVSGNEHCPDGSSCPESSTCCMTKSEEYGCCPFPEGVCCKDKTHCCPTGSRCLGAGLCLRPTSENDIEGAEPPYPTQAAIVDQARRGDQCSEGDCPANSTCCDVPAATHKSCCPLEDAICCLDGLHCCPSGTMCDQEHRRCVDVLYEKKERVTFARLAPPTASNEHCPDGSTCPGVSTCCMTPNKHFGCCPFQNAMCCRDMIHCCPYGTRCIGGGLCQRQYGYGVAKAFRVQENEEVHITNRCTGGKQQCGAGQTCCAKSDGSVACCPMKDAVCCEGQDACCPHGFACSPFGCLKV